MTEEEKKARLEELRELNRQKKAAQALIEKEEQKKNEVSSTKSIPTQCLHISPLASPANTKLTPPLLENSYEVHSRDPRCKGGARQARAD